MSLPDIMYASAVRRICASANNVCTRSRVRWTRVCLCSQISILKFEREERNYVLGQRRNSEKCLRRSRRQVAMACIDYRLGSNHFPLREGFRVGMFYLLCTVDVHAGWLAEFEFVGGGGELCFLASLFPHETVVSFSLSLFLRRDGLPSHSTKDCHCVRVEGEV